MSEVKPSRSPNPSTNPSPNPNPGPSPGPSHECPIMDILKGTSDIKKKKNYRYPAAFLDHYAIYSQ